MSIRDLLVPRPPLRLPRRTIRLRLTIIYASLFLASGAGLLAFTYVLVRDADVIVATRSDGSSVSIGGAEGPEEAPPAQGQFQEQLRDGGPGTRLTPQQAQRQTQRDRALAESQHEAELRQLLERSGIALALMAALSIGLGWFVAGRVLRPLRTLDERAREISASNLHERLALEGPDDELKRLAGTFDDLLGRLEASFQAQRQFVANASHELRTPLARARALSEVALADPEASIASLRASHRRVLVAGEHQEQLIEALLTLARSERGLDEHQQFDLATVAATMLHTREKEAELRGLNVHAILEPAEISGDPPLAERLVANLIDNALRHNIPHGHIDVTTTTRNGSAILSVSNSGPRVPAAELEQLFQPFRRLGADRTDHEDGLGLGLSIVAAIVAAHGATLTPRAQPTGGLEIEVSFRSAGTPTSRSAEAQIRKGTATAGRLVRARRRTEAELERPRHP